ncbi:MAG TPA: septal ring lytic transglycosylase RlpA family protein [Acidimicrobiales bacterium]
MDDLPPLPPEARVELPPSRLPAHARRGRRPARRPAATVAAPAATVAHGMPWESPGILFAVLVTALVLPLLLVSRGSASAVPQAKTVQVRTVAGPTGSSSSVPAPGAGDTSAKLVPIALHRAAAASQHTATTTPSTEAPTTEPPTTAAASSGQAASTTPTTAAPVRTPPPTTAAPPTTAPPTTVASSSHSESGLASYYAHNPGGCASRTVPRGTRVTISANGRTASCVVDDYGPFGAGRIIDLSEEVFGQLASLGTGVISVTVSW